MAILSALGACAMRPPPCAPGHWMSPVTLRPVPDPVAQARDRRVILLGEQHDSAADHRWELTAIAQLHAADPSLVLGAEMFPRSAQPVLDRWSRGDLSEGDFLRQSGWHDFWGFDPGLYLPIFRFARDHHMKMVALNVSRHFVHLVAQRGWDGVPPADREGVGTPAAPDPAYRASLADAMAGHGGPPMTPARLQHFIEAQSVWDRAMAEAIASTLRQDKGARLVAIMGAGHVQGRGGVPHQLDALGVPGALVLVTMHESCAAHPASYADAVFVD